MSVKSELLNENVTCVDHALFIFYFSIWRSNLVLFLGWIYLQKDEIIRSIKIQYLTTVMAFQLRMLDEIKRMKTNPLESDKNILKNLEELAIANGKLIVILYELLVQEEILTADVRRDVDAAVNDVGDDVDAAVNDVGEDVDAAGADVCDAVDFAGAVDVPEE